MGDSYENSAASNTNTKSEKVTKMSTATGGAVQYKKMSEKPTVTTLCGSTRFPEAFALATMHLSLQGRIVIGLGMYGHADQPQGARYLTSDGDESTDMKQTLDELHLRRIDLGDGIYVINVGGYIGSSTKREIAYAHKHNKQVEFMFPDTKPTAQITWPPSTKEEKG